MNPFQRRDQADMNPSKHCIIRVMTTIYLTSCTTGVNQQTAELNYVLSIAYFFILNSAYSKVLD